MSLNRLKTVGIAVAAATVAFCATLGPATANAAPARPAPAGAVITKSVKVDDHRYQLTVMSPAMGKTVDLTVLSPGGTSPRGTLYLLDGAGANKPVSDWVTKGGAPQFFADKNVNVVMPAGGGSTFYTDWQAPDPRFGKPMWESFLTNELPPLINRTFYGNGRNAIAGLSMGAQAAMALTARHPNLYTGAASLSGCPAVTSPVNEGYVTGTVGKDGGISVNMWGPFGSAGWAAHDPSLMVDRFRGKNIYLYAGGGIPTFDDFYRPLDPGETHQQQVAAGAALESGAQNCSEQFSLRLLLKQIPATSDYPMIGLHSWPYWKAALPRAWSVLEPGLW